MSIYRIIGSLVQIFHRGHLESVSNPSNAGLNSLLHHSFFPLIQLSVVPDHDCGFGCGTKETIKTKQRHMYMYPKSKHNKSFTRSLKTIYIYMQSQGTGIQTVSLYSFTCLCRDSLSYKSIPICNCPGEK